MFKRIRFIATLTTLGFAVFAVSLIGTRLAFAEIEAPPTKSNAAIRAFNEGVKHYNAHEFDAAIGALDQAISSDDRFAEAYFLRGVCKQSLNSLESAVMDLDQSIQLKPSFVDAHALRGAIRYEKDQWDSALEDFNFVLSKTPKDGQSLLGRGIIQLNRKNPVGAARDLRAFVRFYPSHPLVPKVKEILAAINKEAGPEAPSNETATAPSEPAASSPRRAERMSGPSAADIANSLLRREGSLSEQFGKHVLRGERTPMTGDLEKPAQASAPRRRAKQDTIEIVDPH